MTAEQELAALKAKLLELSGNAPQTVAVECPKNRFTGTHTFYTRVSRKGECAHCNQLPPIPPWSSGL